MSRAALVSISLLLATVAVSVVALPARAQRTTRNRRASRVRVLDDDALADLGRVAGAPPTLPSTGLVATLDAAWLGAEGLAGGQGAARIRGTWAPLRWLELGAEAGVEAWSLSDGRVGAARLGLSTFLVSAGAGLALGRAAEALRLVAGLGASALGLESLDAADRPGLLALRVDGVFLGSAADLRVQLEVGVAFQTAVGAYGGQQVDLALGNRRGRARLVAGGSTRGSGSGLAVAAHAGVALRLAPRTTLRVVLAAPVLVDDPGGRRLLLSVSLVGMSCRFAC